MERRLRAAVVVATRLYVYNHDPSRARCILREGSEGVTEASAIDNSRAGDRLSPMQLCADDAGWPWLVFGRWRRCSGGQ